MAACTDVKAQLCPLAMHLACSGQLWVADEQRFGLIPVVHKCWTLRGERPTATHQTKCGAIGNILTTTL